MNNIVTEAEDSSYIDKIDIIENKIDASILYQKHKEKIQKTINNLSFRLLIAIPANLIFIRSIVKSVYAMFTLEPTFLFFILLLVVIALWRFTILGETISDIKTLKSISADQQSLIIAKFFSYIFEILALFLIIVTLAIIIDHNIHSFPFGFIATILFMIFISNKIKEGVKKEIMKISMHEVEKIYQINWSDFLD